MKTLSSLALMLLTLWLPSHCVSAQTRESKEKVSREFTLSGDAGRQVLAIYNIFGSVSVEGYAGSKVLLEATKTIRGDDAAGLETGKKEVQLGFLQRGDSLILYLSGPHDSRPRRNQHWDSHDDPYR